MARSTRGLRLGRWLALVLVLVGVAAALVVVNPLTWLETDDDSDAAEPREQVALAVASLSSTVDVDGELVVAQSRPAMATGPGTVTSVLPVGSPVLASTVLFEIDGEPTVALIGDVPAWRGLTVDDEGPDVEQLERNLADLGYDPDGEMTVDQTFTEVTATVVERWQTDLGLEPTGRVGAGTIVFVPGPSEVTSVSATAGQALAAAGSTPLLTLSGDERQVVFEVAADELDTVEPGTDLSVRLPDRSTVAARVETLAPTGAGTWQGVAALVDGPGEAVLPDGEAVPVTVSWTTVLADDVTTVRANALTRLDTGRYVLEVVDDDQTRFVEVEIGSRSGSTVELVTDLEPGTMVIAP